MRPDKSKWACKYTNTALAEFAACARMITSYIYIYIYIYRIDSWLPVWSYQHCGRVKVCNKTILSNIKWLKYWPESSLHCFSTSRYIYPSIHLSMYLSIYLSLYLISLSFIWLTIKSFVVNIINSYEFIYQSFNLSILQYINI